MCVVHNAVVGSGYYRAVRNVARDPNPGDVFDAAMMPVGDGLAGYGGGNIARNVQAAGPVSAVSRSSCFTRPVIFSEFIIFCSRSCSIR
jgi:hypothetical protein